MSYPQLKDAVPRRTEVRRMYQQGFPRGEILRKISEKYGVTTRTVDNDLAVIQEEIREDGKAFATEAREIITSALWEVVRGALGHDQAEASEELLTIAGDALSEDEMAAEVVRARYPHLRKRDFTAAVSALREIGKLHGAYAPEKREVSHTTGVLVIPGQMSVDEWKEKHLQPPTEGVIDAEFQELPAASDDTDW